MQTLLTALGVVIAVAIVALHLFSVIFSGKRSLILNFVNIALHTVLVFVMLFNGAALELVALAFMLSLLVYTLGYEIKRRRGGDKR